MPLALGASAELWLMPLRLEAPQEANHHPDRYFCAQCPRSLASLSRSGEGGVGEGRQRVPGDSHAGREVGRARAVAADRQAEVGTFELEAGIPGLERRHRTWILDFPPNCSRYYLATTFLPSSPTSVRTTASSCGADVVRRWMASRPSQNSFSSSPNPRRYSSKF